MPAGTPWIYNDDSGIIMINEGVSFCPTCPACEEGASDVTICGCDFPATFDVEGSGFSNSSCSSCSIFNVRKPVTYTGSVTDCGGTDYHIWASVDDVYGSPGDCSGDFDDRKLFVLIEPSGCEAFFKLRASTDDPCGSYDASDPIRADSGFWVSLPSGCSGSIDLAPFGITWTGGLQCSPGTWIAHPFGT